MCLHGLPCRAHGRPRELLDDAIRDLEQFLGFGDRDAGHGGRHVKQRPFLKRGHEFPSQLEIDWDGRDDKDESGCDDNPFPAERPCSHGLVEPDQEPADGMCFLRMNSAYENGVRCPAQPAWPEIEIPHVRKNESQSRIPG